jgi:hypothetical protein
MVYMAHGPKSPTIGKNFTRKNFRGAAMSLLKKISEAKFHETAKTGSAEISEAGKTPSVESSAAGNFSAAEISSPDVFPCGHPVASFAWICSATRRARCSVCDPRMAGVGPAQRSTILAAQGDDGDESPALAESSGDESSEINPGERHGSAFAFFDVSTPNGAYHVATRFPALWGRSGGTRQKPATNVAAGVIFGLAAEREGPSLGHARFASIHEWQRSLGVELDEQGRAVTPDSILATRRRVE